jgi:hypothetical protein
VSPKLPEGAQGDEGEAVTALKVTDDEWALPKQVR